MTRENLHGARVA